MIAPYCERHGRRILLSDSDIVSVINASEGIVVRNLPGRPLLRASVGAWNDDSDLERLLAAIAPDTRSWRGERAAAEERA